ncbi:ORC-CDC6 family AAA ATPase [Stutzerimonas nitrititolerans]|uniref:ORC-CDC6 family AAA ATPase n=1 Tax=Stutzerimonas nitrititolerans TaxID=2482751 RepID=UPI000F796C87|nr:ATP-binding protein [Stutzerimonas nitrititolerans]RRV26111.1 ATP-binding protein [Pseudomonas sp. s199]
MLTLKSEKIKTCVGQLSNNVRAENIDYKSYIELYSGTENIHNINNINNTVVYGRRGSGKTHLLRALQEQLIIDFQERRNFPVYVDLRRIIPLLPSDKSSPDSAAILIFKYLTQELAHTIATNLSFIYNINELDSNYNLSLSAKTEKTLDIFKKVYLEFDGKKFKKPSSLKVSEEEIKSLGANGTLSSSPSFTGKAERTQKTALTTDHDSYISILNITNELEELITELNLTRITILIDEWSEVDSDVQLFLAELIKKSFSAIKISTKIAAIPNRTNLGIKKEQKFFGLEDGGDIFGYPLDTRYVFEVNKSQTRDFFNDLLHRHLSAIDEISILRLLKDNKTTKEKTINLFLANVALSEILVACAGIPRDFMNLFINAYDRFLLSSGKDAKRISVKNLRSANAAWYETDKKEQVDKHHVERQLLIEIVKEVIERKKSMHFLIPEKHAKNKHILNLIDFRVIHLRKSGYSHQDHSGTSYNVYSVDYGCYNSLNIARNKLDTSVLDKINLKELREIRRISLEDSFFQSFLMNIGEAFSCPHCSKPVDTNHLAYQKQNLCNNCYEKIPDGE